MRRALYILAKSGQSNAFWAFAEAYYRKIMDRAFRWAARWGFEGPIAEQLALVIFEKLATPSVYLVDAFNDLSPEEKAEYDPNLRKELEKAKERAGQVYRPKSEAP